MKLKTAIKKVRDALFPLNITCDLCGAEVFDGLNLCRNCAQTVELNDKTVCPVCGRKTARPEICAECKADAPKFKMAASAIIYRDGGAKLVNKYKNGAVYLKSYLGGLMAKKAAALPPCDFITYVPLTKKKRRRRGYNQSELLALEIGERLNLPVAGVLEKKRETADQKNLSKRERTENLRACFTVADRGAVKDKAVLLCDDILTTGATADEACRQLLIAGAKYVCLITAASVEYRLP